MEKEQKSIRDRLTYDSVVLVPRALASSKKIGEVVAQVDGMFGCAGCLSGRDYLFKDEERFWNEMKQIFRDDVRVTEDLQVKGIFEDTKIGAKVLK